MPHIANYPLPSSPIVGRIRRDTMAAMHVIQLDAAETAEFRRRVSIAHHQRRRGFKRPIWITFDGGPLDGLRCPIEWADAAGQFLAWCLVRDDGPVQATYRKTDHLRTWRFNC